MRKAYKTRLGLSSGKFPMKYTIFNIHKLFDLSEETFDISIRRKVCGMLFFMALKVNSYEIQLEIIKKKN